MRILLVASGFFPEQSPRSFRASELAKEFSRLGHDVTVITHFRDGQTEFSEKYRIRFIQMPHISWPSVTPRGTGITNYWTRFWSRIPAWLFEYPGIQRMFHVKKVLKTLDGFDLMISFAVPFPVHWGIALSRSKKHQMAKTWVADCGDPYMGNENDTFKPPFYFAYLEKYFMRKADFVTVPISSAVKAYYPEFYPKIRVIPQAFRFSDFPKPVSPAQDEKPIFYYAGSLIPGFRDAGPLCEALIRSPKDFRFVIYTKQQHLVEQYTSRSNGRIIVKAPIPRADLLEEMSRAHFLVNIENAGGKAQLPSKLIEYGILRKPILSIGKSVNEGLLNAFLSGNYSGGYHIENIEQYKIQKVAKQFIDLSYE